MVLVGVRARLIWLVAGALVNGVVNLYMIQAVMFVVIVTDVE